MSSRKDYESVAHAFRVARNGTLDIPPSKNRSLALDAFDRLANDLAAVFANHNPRFDKAKFLAACDGTSPA